jgi:hypothetical protein
MVAALVEVPPVENMDVALVHREDVALVADVTVNTAVARVFDVHSPVASHDHTGHKM